MTPSTNQSGKSSVAEHDTMQERMMQEKPEHVLLSIKPMDESRARLWLGAASQYGGRDVVEHFASEVRRLKE